MASSKRARLTEGPIAKTLVLLALPMLIGIFSMIAFNLADTFFVGQLGTQELAAISFTFPVVLTIGSVAAGLGVGASAVISRAIGRGDHGQVQRLTTDALILSVLVVAVFVVVGMLTIDSVFRLMGADESVLPLIRQYMLVWYPGMIFVVVPMVGNNAIRATGDTKTPSMIMLVAVVVNIVLDPLLIFGLGPFPALGLRGAAIATVLARASTLAVSLWVLYFREEMITLHAPPSFAVALRGWGSILYIGVPAAATNMIIPIGVGIITGMVAVYGAAAVAALGVASRVETFALVLVMALGSVLGPFVGQNLGASNPQRVSAGVRFAQQFSIVWGLIVFVLLLLFGRSIGAIFNDDPTVVQVTALYLSIVPLGYGAQGVLQLSTITLNILGKPLHAAVLTLLRMFVLYLPLAYVGSHLLGIEGIFAAAVIANFVAGAAAFYWLRRQLTAIEARMPHPMPTQPSPSQPLGAARSP